MRTEGYLAKRGKSFGKWKMRYFVIQPSFLEYYDSVSFLAQSTGTCYVPYISATVLLNVDATCIERRHPSGHDIAQGL